MDIVFFRLFFISFFSFFFFFFFFFSFFGGDHNKPDVIKLKKIKVYREYAWKEKFTITEIMWNNSTCMHSHAWSQESLAGITCKLDSSWEISPKNPHTKRKQKLHPLVSLIHSFSIYLMKEVCLFCFVLYCRYEIHQSWMLKIVFLLSFESSQQRGVHGLGSMVFGLAVQKFMNTEWCLHWKLN
jgi:hypothetical protein